MKKKLLLFGSTGSIGASVIDIVARNRDKYEIVLLSCRRNYQLLAQQANELAVPAVHIVDSSHAAQLRELLPTETKLSVGADVYQELIAECQADLVVNAIVGCAGLEASCYALMAGTDLALANKESMVAGGELLNSIRARTGARIIPIDSEHSAIWQCMMAGHREEVEKVILTASGGPFRKRDKSTLRNVTVEEALAHPNWNMGAKITIDSATMMNKGLEVIEACYLFNLRSDQIEIVIHPESIIHSMVQFIDGSQVAQLSPPDMRLPVAVALAYPDRIETDLPRTDFPRVGSLTFEAPDIDRFPSILLAYKAIEQGGAAPVTLNAANEIAVKSFLAGEITFTDIPKLVAEMLKEADASFEPTLEKILKADVETRIKTAELIKTGTLT